MQSNTQNNKAIAQRYIEEVLNRGNLQVVDELFAPTFVSHFPTSPDPLLGPQAAKQIATTYRTSFPDLRFTIDEIVAEGDNVCVRWTGTGTHRATLQGIPPTNKAATVMGFTMARISGGKVQEDWVCWDQLSMLQQLGVVPQQAQAVGAQRR